MTRKTMACNAGNSGRVNISGPKIDKLEAEIGDEVEVDVVDMKEVAHVLIDSKETDYFFIVTPA